MLKVKSLWLIGAVILAGAGISCKKDNNNNPSGSKGATIVTDLPGDTAATPGSPAKTIYFSFVSNTTVDSSQKKTGNWDIAFTNIYNSYVTINNGTNPVSPGFGGSTQGALYLVSKPFDSVKTVPASTEMNVNGSAGMDGYPSASWPGWYQYNMTTHILSTIQGKTLVIRLANGKYAKLEMISLYKGSPASPSLSTPVPYLSFRYWVQQDGSTNLQVP
jgi:hypothetical protein